MVTVVRLYGHWCDCRNRRLISRSEKDLLSVDPESAEYMNIMARHAVKKQRATLPRGFGSTECIYTSEQTNDMPDKVIKVYKADQTCKYFMVYKVCLWQKTIWKLCVGLFALPLNESEVGVDLVLIESSLLFLCNFALIGLRTASLTWIGCHITSLFYLGGRPKYSFWGKVQ